MDSGSLGFSPSPKRGRRLARSVYSGPILDELRSAIAGGRFEKGTRLVEERLAAEFGVSRGPIRSALLALESEGLVTTLQTGGMVVAGFGIEDLSSLLRVRHLLESSAIRWGLEAGTDQEPLYTALAALAHTAAGLKEDTAFHRSIAEFGQAASFSRRGTRLLPFLRL